MEMKVIEGQEEGTKSRAGGISGYLRTRYRYLAYLLLLCTIFVEMISRFGVPVAMIGGMVKENCTDPADEGAYCWSEDVKATVLGAFFYGYIAQFPITVLGRYLGFTRVLRLYMLVSFVTQCFYPLMASVSTALLIISQVLRGSLAGILISNNFEFIRHWTLKSESRYFISAIGTTNYIGVGVGPVLAALLTDLTGSWTYYFYVTGGMFLLVLLLHGVFVPDDPADSRFMTDEEKSLYSAEKPPNTEPGSTAEKAKERTRVDWKNLLQRSYLWSFCIYTLAYNLIFYGISNVTPFYLNEVLGASKNTISYISLAVNIVIAVSTIILSVVFQWVDKYTTWIKCRMLFTLAPFILQMLLFAVFPQVGSIYGVTIVLVICGIICGSLFSGSVITINYELDPVNSSIMLSIFNSVGQVSGFLGPLLMAKITYTDPETADYSEVYRGKWQYIFYVNGVFAGVAVLAVLGSYLARPGEWVPVRDTKSTDTSVVFVNRNSEEKLEKP